MPSLGQSNSLDMQLEQPRGLPVHSEARVPQAPVKRSDFSSLNSKAEKFMVNGTAIPDLPFDIGDSYAGLLPISDKPDEPRQLCFWFFPSKNLAAGDEVVIWLNGGPGYSSLGGLLRGSGPFLWQPGTIAPIQNTHRSVNSLH